MEDLLQKASEIKIPAKMAMQSRKRVLSILNHYPRLKFQPFQMSYFAKIRSEILLNADPLSKYSSFCLEIANLDPTMTSIFQDIMSDIKFKAIKEVNQPTTTPQPNNLAASIRQIQAKQHVKQQQTQGDNKLLSVPPTPTHSRSNSGDDISLHAAPSPSTLPPPAVVKTSKINRSGKAVFLQQDQDKKKDSKE